MAFLGNPSLTRTFQDGTSNRIAFAEHYTRCQSMDFLYQVSIANDIFSRRATFADFEGYADNVPKNGVIPSVTFQVTPKNCDSWTAQTAHSAGMLVALADGSCRMVGVGISPSTYWAAVTPAGGDFLGPDW